MTVDRLTSLWAFPLLALAAPGSAQNVAGPSQAWELSIAGGIQDLAFSPGEDCIAVVSPDQLIVLDTTGAIRWEMPFARLGHWVKADHAAAAPGCAWVVLGGTASYRYALIVSRDTPRARAVPTRGTPASVAVNHGGTLAAVGTAAGMLYLIDPTGKVVKTRDFQYSILDGLRFSRDDRLLALTGGSPVGVLKVAGDTLWTADLGGMLAADSAWNRFVSWWEPPHFSTLGRVAYLDERGAERWGMGVHYPSAAIAPDGSYVVLVGVLQDTSATEEQSDEINDGRFLVVDSAGRRHASGPSPVGHAVAVYPSGEMFVIRERGGENDLLVARTREGVTVWTLPLPAFGRLLATDDLRLFIVADGERLTGYR